MAAEGLWWTRPCIQAMPRKHEATATKVFIDPVVLTRVDESKPAAISRTGWVNYLVQLGLASIKQQQSDA